MVVAHARNKAEAALIAASKNVYWLAKELLGTYKYSSLNSLTKLQECAAIQDVSVAKNSLLQKLSHSRSEAERQFLVVLR